MAQRLDELIDALLEHRHEPMIIGGFWAQYWIIVERARRARRAAPASSTPRPSSPAAAARRAPNAPRRLRGADPRVLRHLARPRDSGLRHVGAVGRLRRGRRPVPADAVGDPADARRHAARSCSNQDDGPAEGRFAFFDVSLEGRWGGVITGDHVDRRLLDAERRASSTGASSATASSKAATTSSPARARSTPTCGGSWNEHRHEPHVAVPHVVRGRRPGARRPTTSPSTKDFATPRARSRRAGVAPRRAGTGVRPPASPRSSTSSSRWASGSSSTTTSTCSTRSRRASRSARSGRASSPRPTRAGPACSSGQSLWFQVDQEVGRDVLDGWTRGRRPPTAGCAGSARSRRASSTCSPATRPASPAITIARGALTKGVHLLKLPSNDLFTGTAILRTMAEVDPDHPVTQSFSCVYWRGGDPDGRRRAVPGPVLRPARRLGRRRRDPQRDQVHRARASTSCRSTRRSRSRSSVARRSRPTRRWQESARGRGDRRAASSTRRSARRAASSTPKATTTRSRSGARSSPRARRRAHRMPTPWSRRCPPTSGPRSTCSGRWRRCTRCSAPTTVPVS